MSESSVGLVVRGMTAGYDDLPVLRGIELSAAPGSVTVVLGRNGAGKTTMLRGLSGLLRSCGFGQFSLNGTDLKPLSAQTRVKAGLGHVQEGKRVFRSRTVHENLLLGTYPLWGAFGHRRERMEALDDAYARFPALREKRGNFAGSLSGGQQQMLAIAQALTARPKVLLLDEPSAGLAPAIVADVMDIVGTLRDEGMAVVLVEQVVDVALTAADHVVVLENGQVAASGPVADFSDRDRVRNIYLGRVPAAMENTSPHAPGGPG